jgi:hypothetical protein
MINLLNPTSSGDVSILYKESTASLRASIKNYGLPQNSLPVVFKLEDVNGTVLGDYSQIKSAGNLNTDDEKDISFSWMPKEEGDFYLILEVGDYEADWTPGDNRIGFYIHVRSAIEEK